VAKSWSLADHLDMTAFSSLRITAASFERLKRQMHSYTISTLPPMCRGIAWIACQSKYVCTYTCYSTARSHLGCLNVGYACIKTRKKCLTRLCHKHIHVVMHDRSVSPADRHYIFVTYCNRSVIVRRSTAIPCNDAPSQEILCAPKHLFDVLTYL